MNQKKISGVIALLVGLAAMVFSIYIFMLGRGSNSNLLSVMLYLCSGAVFFFWGINIIIPGKRTERKHLQNELNNGRADHQQ